MLFAISWQLKLKMRALDFIYCKLAAIWNYFFPPKKKLVRRTITTEFYPDYYTGRLTHSWRSWDGREELKSD